MPRIQSQKKKRKGSNFMTLSITQETGLSPGIPDIPKFLVWDGYDKDFVFFEDGAVVAWNVSTFDLVSLDSLVKSYSTNLILPLKEEMVFEYGEKALVDIERDKIVISTRPDNFEEKILFSLALARSVKIDDLELAVERAVHKARALDFGVTTSTRGHPKKKGIEARNELANLYNLRYQMTVHSRLLEDPGYFWDKPSQYQNLYHQLVRWRKHSNSHDEESYLDLESRTENVQEKLELPTSYWELENQHAGELISWRLEKMIILIIALELVLGLLSKSRNWKEWTFEDFGDSMLLQLGYDVKSNDDDGNEVQLEPKAASENSANNA